MKRKQARKGPKMEGLMAEQKAALAEDGDSAPIDLSGNIPESWLCIDCGFDTAPGCLNRSQFERAIAELGDKWTDENGVKVQFNNRSEVYHVRSAIWKKAGIADMGGCLCIGCLEKRLGRKLKPKDFKRDHPFNRSPGTPRLLERRGKPKGDGNRRPREIPL